MRIQIQILTLLVALPVACSHQPALKEASDNFPIIDAHVHAHFSGKPNRFNGMANTKENMMTEMRESGVVGGVSHLRGYAPKQDLSDMHILQCAGVHEAKPNAAELEASLKAKTVGCIKMYLGYVPQYATHKNYEIVYQLAEKYQVPVVFHTGDTSDSDALVKYADPMDIDEVAVKHPKVIFVLAHLGNPWIQTAAEIVYKNANVYADVSAFLIGNLEKPRKAEQVDEYLVKPIAWAFGYIEGSKKLMYGSDWPLVGMRPYIAAVKKAIPKKHWHDVFYNNAMTVFKLKGLSPEIEEVR